MMDRLKDRLASDERLAGLRDRYGYLQKELIRGLPGERRRRERRALVMGFLGGMVVGGALTYLLDPVLGRTRRARLADQAVARAREAARDTERFGRKVASDVEGRIQATRRGTEDYVAPNDVTLARKVESEVLGRPDVPKGSVLVNVEHGRVVLRGTVERPEVRDELTRLVLDVDGVDEVENLVQVPGHDAEGVRRLAR
ncbi:MAG TPA: BON domain-containing protein [Actinomycetota bacterium]